MSKRRSTLDGENVMNDINEWLEVEPDHYAENNLNELVGEQDDYNNDNIDRTEDDINKDERDNDVEEAINQRQGHFREQIARKRLAHI